MVNIKENSGSVSVDFGVLQTSICGSKILFSPNHAAFRSSVQLNEQISEVWGLRTECEAKIYRLTMAAWGSEHWPSSLYQQNCLAGIVHPPGTG